MKVIVLLRLTQKLFWLYLLMNKVCGAFFIELQLEIANTYKQKV